MPSANKAKGNRGELFLAGILGEAFGGHFSRVPSSGAMVGGIHAARKAFLSKTQTAIYKGDLIAPDHMPKFIVESKNYNELKFHQLITPGSCPQLDTWIGQSMETIDPGDFWVVCFKISRIGWFIALHEDFTTDMTFGNNALYTGAHGTFRVCQLEDFLSRNKEACLKLSA